MANLGPNFWLTRWDWEPSILIGTVLIIGLYLYLIGPFAERHGFERISQGRAVAFLLGVDIIFLALVSPLDRLGDKYLFSAHMVQHLCLTMVGPPLVVMGIPDWFLRPIVRNKVLFAIARFLTYPAVAFVLFNADFFLWHAPSLYDATLVNSTLHIFEHLTFIATGLLFWWPLLSTSKDLPRLSIGGQVLYLFLGGMPSVLLGAGLTFAPPLYTPYIYAPRAWGISAATDQQLGGLIMWIPVNIGYIIVMSILFLRWMQKKEAEQVQREREMWEQEDAERERLAEGREASQHGRETSQHGREAPQHGHDIPQGDGQHRPYPQASARRAD
jgi:cytochrome c oxidase assembly factor CtaG